MLPLNEINDPFIDGLEERELSGGDPKWCPFKFVVGFGLGEWLGLKGGKAVAC